MFTDNFSLTFLFVVFWIVLTKITGEKACLFCLLIGQKRYINTQDNLIRQRYFLVRIVVKNGYIFVVYIFFRRNFRLLSFFIIVFNAEGGIRTIAKRGEKHSKEADLYE